MCKQDAHANKLVGFLLFICLLSVPFIRPQLEPSRIEGKRIFPSHRFYTHFFIFLKGSFKKSRNRRLFPYHDFVKVHRTSNLVAQMVKSLPAVQETQGSTQVRSLGQEDPLEKEMATHSSILA